MRKTVGKPSDGNDEETQKAVIARMQELGLHGFDGYPDGGFTPADHLRHLEAIAAQREKGRRLLGKKK